MYELGAQRIGADAGACVFVDDLAFNLDPARELGMAVVHHTAAATTLAELDAAAGLAQRRELHHRGRGERCRGAGGVRDAPAGTDVRPLLSARAPLGRAP